MGDDESGSDWDSMSEAQTNFHSHEAERITGKGPFFQIRFFSNMSFPV
jgi:hypothetical protein